GQTAQFSLQLTPGAGYTGIVSLSCSGAPQGATCQLPSTLQITNGNAAPFMVSVTTSGGASGILPYSSVPRATPFPILRAVPGLTVCTVLLLLLSMGFSATRDSSRWPRRHAFGGAASVTALLTTTCLILSAILTAAGCGGGSSAITTPPQIVTPQGTSNIVVTPAAKSVNGQPLQLQPIQLTLTVK
ncbi:MAG: hypothetical protein ACYDHE_21875, partial [Candidatus Acidiferrales bacterium]